MTGRDYLVTIRWKTDSLWSRATQSPCLCLLLPIPAHHWLILWHASSLLRQASNISFETPANRHTLFVLGIPSLSSRLAFHRVHLLPLLSTCALCQLGQRAINPECGLKAYRRGWAQRMEISLFNSDFRHDAHSKEKELGLFEKWAF